MAFKDVLGTALNPPEGWVADGEYFAALETAYDEDMAGAAGDSEVLSNALAEKDAIIQGLNSQISALKSENSSMNERLDSYSNSNDESDDLDETDDLPDIDDLFGDEE